MCVRVCDNDCLFISCSVPTIYLVPSVYQSIPHLIKLYHYLVCHVQSQVCLTCIDTTIPSLFNRYNNCEACTEWEIWLVVCSSVALKIDSYCGSRANPCIPDTSRRFDAWIQFTDCCTWSRENGAVCLLNWSVTLKTDLESWCGSDQPSSICIIQNLLLSSTPLSAGVEELVSTARHSITQSPSHIVVTSDRIIPIRPIRDSTRIRKFLRPAVIDPGVGTRARAQAMSIVIANKLRAADNSAVNSCHR